MKGSAQESYCFTAYGLHYDFQKVFAYANTTICCKEHFAFLKINSISSLPIELVAETTLICFLCLVSQEAASQEATSLQGKAV